MFWFCSSGQKVAEQKKKSSGCSTGRESVDVYAVRGSQESMNCESFHLGLVSY